MHTPKKEKTQAQRNAEVQAVANKQVQFMFPRYIQGSIHNWQRIADAELQSR